MMTRQKRCLLALSALLLAALVVRADLVTWDFPKTNTCHEGLAFADGVTGVLAWGGGDELRLTLGRADLWDHRGGYPWLASQSYTNIVALVQNGKKDDLLGLFKKVTPKGEPRNPYMLPLGRLVVKIPGEELKTGTLDPYSGWGEITLASGRKIEMAMSKKSRVFMLKMPEGVKYEVRSVPATEHAAFYERTLKPLGFEKAKIREDGWDWSLPADPSVSVRYLKRGGELAVWTYRGPVVQNSSTFNLQPSTSFAQAKVESQSHWRKFWNDGARVKVPDPVVQRCFEYGMYRFGAMTDPDGVPAGLQGAWLEDDKLVPWNGDYHFNINVQECYSPAYRGGHFENLMPLFRMVLAWRPLLRANAKRFVGIDDGYALPHSVDDRGVCIGGFWTGTIDHASTAWVAAMMMKYARYSGDAQFLRDGAYDFMKGAMRVYRAMMEERGGRLSIPLGPSPEWGAADVAKAVGRDPSFQLAAAHRLAADLVDAAALVGEEPDAMWFDVIRRLPRYSCGAGGIQLFEGQPFVESHRHHSHLAGLYPFDVLDLSDARTRDDVAESYRTWVLRGTGFWTGWCVPWASILNTHLGHPEAAVARLHDFETYFCNSGHGAHHNAVETGFTVFDHGLGIMQMDGQCAAATAVMELLVHEVNGEVRFFQGCPAAWKDVWFENVALADGRRVCGRRVNGQVQISYAEPLQPNRGVAILMLTNETATMRRPAAAWLAARGVPYHFTKRLDEHGVYAVLGAETARRMTKTQFCELLDGCLLLDTEAAAVVASLGLADQINWGAGKFAGVADNAWCGHVGIVEPTIAGGDLMTVLRRLGYGARPASAPLDLLSAPTRTRNSEGDFIRLKDGRILFAYTRFTGGTGQDHDGAVIASRESADGGRTWSVFDRTLVENEGGQNVMEASFLRMTDGSIALFCLRKNSNLDCRPIMKRSYDEGETWTASRVLIPDDKVDYYCINNSRVIRTKSGRLVLPMGVAGHQSKKEDPFSELGFLSVLLSDDDGETWRIGCKPFATFDADGARVACQEPGVVELKDGRLRLWARTRTGRQWTWTSSDGGESWTKGEPWTLFGPLSPATVVRLKGGDLLAVWNDHESHPEIAAEKQLYGGTRRPLSLAVSSDDGLTWTRRLTVEDDPGHSRGWYCYSSVLEMDDYLVIHYSAEQWLQRSRIMLVPLKDLYSKQGK